MTEPLPSAAFSVDLVGTVLLLEAADAPAAAPGDLEL
jgi:hypothetical protein